MSIRLTGIKDPATYEKIRLLCVSFSRLALIIALIFSLALSILPVPTPAAAIAFGLSVALSLAFYFNHKGYIEPARTLLLILINLSVFFVDLFLGRHSGIFLLFIPAIAFHLLLFDNSEKRSMVLLTSFTILLIIILEWNNHSLFDVHFKLSKTTNWLIYYLSLFLSVVATIYCVIFLKTSTAQVEKQLLDQKVFFEDILNKLPADLVVFDKNNYYIFLNPSAVKDPEVRKWMLGKSEQDYFDFRKKEREFVQVRKIAFAKVLEEKREAAFEESIPDSQGKLRHYIRRMSPVLDANGEVSFVIGYGLDISELKKVQIDLMQAKQVAEQASRSKSSFLSNVSHEIRTPLNAIIGLTNLLIEDPEDKNLHENLRVIKYSADNLLALINDILDLSKIEEDKITIERIGFSLPQLLTQLEKTIQLKTIEKKLELVIDSDPSVPAILVGDPLRVNQVLLNLCTNAVKFTEKGSVVIKTRLLKNENGKVLLELSVTDTGIGIAPEKLETIFDSFTQAEAYTTRRYGGTGLGLSISKKLCALMGGSLEVRSQPGKGSTFTATIPFTVSSAERVKTGQLNISSGKNLSSVRILMAEDNVINQLLSKQLFKRWGNELDIAANGFEAIEMIRSKKYDLLIIDLQMPEMDGITAMRKIRSGEAGIENASLTAIALTADVFETTRKNAREAGFSDFVTKPFNSDELYGKILHYLYPEENS